jgi:hypothetical protein
LGKRLLTPLGLTDISESDTQAGTSVLVKQSRIQKSDSMLTAHDPVGRIGTLDTARAETQITLRRVDGTINDFSPEVINGYRLRKYNELYHSSALSCIYIPMPEILRLKMR